MEKLNMILNGKYGYTENDGTKLALTEEAYLENVPYAGEKRMEMPRTTTSRVITSTGACAKESPRPAMTTMRYSKHER